jgi:hypothetical protein
MAAVGFAGCSMPSYDRALHALRFWLDSWSGIGRIAVGMARQGFAVAGGSGRRVASVAQRMRKRGGWTIAAKK